VPDRQLIMENMLMAEGFVEAKVLAKKFASLYYLLEDLLSPQKHYDWGLRAIKSVLVVAGSLLRAEAGQVESDVLFRALRDFNIPKILAQARVAGLCMSSTYLAAASSVSRRLRMCDGWLVPPVRINTIFSFYPFAISGSSIPPPSRRTWSSSWAC
jgi:hypothetical protein